MKKCVKMLDICIGGGCYNEFVNKKQRRIL